MHGPWPARNPRALVAMGQGSPREARKARTWLGTNVKTPTTAGRSLAGCSRPRGVTDQRPKKGERKERGTAGRSPVPVASGVPAASMTELGGQRRAFGGEAASGRAAQQRILPGHRAHGEGIGRTQSVF